ncbi:MAG: tyrosine-type recombinase/integrase [Kiritimatiellae bacterium]|nr:tyrosine-type recombinase/integrase [Kiritimatiellia bacterium]
MKLFKGTLYKRARGRYLPASSKQEGRFYYQFPLQGAPRNQARVCLQTGDAVVAEERAMVLTGVGSPSAPMNLAEAIALLLRVIQTRYGHDDHALRPTPQPAVPARTEPEPQHADDEIQEKLDALPPCPRVPLTDLWFHFIQRYEIAKTSFTRYRQILRNFQNWTDAEFADQVTRPVAEAYIRHIFSRKVSARQELNTLKRIWHTIWPENTNPWDNGLRLLPKQRTGVTRYRRLTLEEARSFQRQLAQERDKRQLQDRDGDSRRNPDEADRRRTIDADLYDDLHDALFFAWNYGMRIGSLASLRWEDFKLEENRDYFLHVPPKTKGMKPWPLELPFLPEISTILLARMKRYAQRPSGWLFPTLHETYTYRMTRITAVVKRTMKAAGVFDDHRGRATMHSFRASFITRMDEAGCPSGVTDSVTGHAPQTMHDIYSHSSISAKRRWIIRAIPPLGSDA